MVYPCSNYKLEFLKLARYTSEIIIFLFLHGICKQEEMNFITWFVMKYFCRCNHNTFLCWSFSLIYAVDTKFSNVETSLKGRESTHEVSEVSILKILLFGERDKIRNIGDTHILY